MPDDPSFADLMARLRAGDDEAAARVFHRFARRLIALAGAHLAPALKQKEDPEDVVLSAFKSFFRRQAGRPFALDGWDSLWSLLALITIRKCRDRAEEYHAACRDIDREAAGDERAAAGWRLYAREPTPSEAAMLAETLQLLLREFNERDRQIGVLSLQGQTIPAVSADLGCTERTVYRVLARVKSRLEALRDGR